MFTHFDYSIARLAVSVKYFVWKELTMPSFECSNCKKKYKSKHWFDKHMKSHDNVQENAAVETVSAGKMLHKILARIISNYWKRLETYNLSFNSDNHDNDDDKVTAAIEAVGECDWLQWSDEDDENESESYFHLQMEPWQEDEEEDRRRAQLIGIEEPWEPEEQREEKTRKAFIKCPECQSTFNTLEEYIKHRISHCMQGESS